MMAFIFRNLLFGGHTCHIFHVAVQLQNVGGDCQPKFSFLYYNQKTRFVEDYFPPSNDPTTLNHKFPQPFPFLHFHFDFFSTTCYFPKTFYRDNVFGGVEVVEVSLSQEPRNPGTHDTHHLPIGWVSLIPRLRPADLNASPDQNPEVEEIRTLRQQTIGYHGNWQKMRPWKLMLTLDATFPGKKGFQERRVSHKSSCFCVCFCLEDSMDFHPPILVGLLELLPNMFIAMLTLPSLKRFASEFTNT